MYLAACRAIYSARWIAHEARLLDDDPAQYLTRHFGGLCDFYRVAGPTAPSPRALVGLMLEVACVSGTAALSAVRGKFAGQASELSGQPGAGWVS